MQDNWTVSCDVDEDGLYKKGIMSVSDGWRGSTHSAAQCAAVSWQEQGEKAKKKEPLPRLCHCDGDDNDANCDIGWPSNI